MKTKLTIPLTIIAAATLIPPALASTPETNIGTLIQTLFTNQTTLIIFLIELLLGFGLGYFSVKTFKNILALIGIFILGVLLNVWQAPQLGTSLTQLGLTLEKTTAIATTLIIIFGLTTVLPITVGFILGLVVGFVR